MVFWAEPVNFRFDLEMMEWGLQQADHTWRFISGRTRGNRSAWHRFKKEFYEKS